VTDLQLEVPKRVKDSVGDVLLEFSDLRGLFGLGIEKHHIHIAQRAQLAPAIAAEGDQAGGDGRFAVLQAPSRQGRGEEGYQQAIHAVGQGAGDLPAGFTGLMALADAPTFGLQVSLAGGQTAGCRGLSGEDRLDGHRGGGADGHGRGLHEQRKSHGGSWKYRRAGASHEFNNSG
jgi:hypothetical protein